MRLPRVRPTVRRLVKLAALLSVSMVVYVILVERPARRRRYLDADRAVTIQIELLRRAAAHERQQERAEVDRAAKNRDSAEADEGARAALWLKAAEKSEAANATVFQLAQQARALPRAQLRHKMDFSGEGFFLRSLDGVRGLANVLCDGAQRYASRLFNPEFLRSKKLPVPAWLDGRAEIGVKTPLV